MGPAKSRRLTIFEGPDGAGKTTIAKAFASATNARYVHFSALPHVNGGLARLYVEAMLPALLGYQDVVFDRSWLSELPYGIAFREGKDRLGDASRRMLERLALRCGGAVVYCDPGWDVVRANFLVRKHLEMLDDEEQLQMVYETYATQTTDLPVSQFNYLEHDLVDLLSGPLSEEACHPLDLGTAGAWSAMTNGVVLVGQDYAEVKDQCPLYRWPFASFERGSCGQWLAQQLELAEIPESRLFWVNADQPLQELPPLLRSKVIALGSLASRRLTELDITHAAIDHPQHHKRFAHRTRYPLVDLINEALL